MQAGSAARQEGFAAIRPAAGRHHTLCWALLSSPFPTLGSLSAAAGAAPVELMATRTVFVSQHCHSAELSNQLQLQAQLRAGHRQGLCGTELCCPCSVPAVPPPALQTLPASPIPGHIKCHHTAGAPTSSLGPSYISEWHDL